jgi:hypothetical protein
MFNSESKETGKVSTKDLLECSVDNLTTALYLKSREENFEDRISVLHTDSERAEYSVKTGLDVINETGQVMIFIVKER